MTASAVPGTEFRIAVVGMGKLGLLHAALMNALPGSRLAAIVDSNETVTGIFTKHTRGVRGYADHRRLIADGGVDAAVIATPTHLHVPVAKDFVAARIPVLIEKPLAHTAAHAQELDAMVRATGIVAMVGYMGRFLPPFAKAKEIVASGALDAPQILRSSMYMGQMFRRGKGWRYDPAMSGGGVLMTQNSHLIDKLLWLFGDVISVSGHAAPLYSEKVEDYVHAHLVFASGLRGYVDGSWSARHFRTPSITIHVQGANGTLGADDDGVHLYLEQGRSGYAAGWTHWLKPDLYHGVSIDIGGPQYTLQAEAFLAALKGGPKPGCDVAAGCRTQLLIDAIYRSAAQDGAPIEPGRA